MFRGNLLLVSIIAAAIGAWVAARKGRSALFWSLASAFFLPMLLLLLVLPRRYAPGINKRCPYCGGVIDMDAPACTRCGRELPIEMVKCPSCGEYVPERSYCPRCSRRM